MEQEEARKILVDVVRYGFYRPILGMRLVESLLQIPAGGALDIAENDSAVYRLRLALNACKRLQAHPQTDTTLLVYLMACHLELGHMVSLVLLWSGSEPLRFVHLQMPQSGGIFSSAYQLQEHLQRLSEQTYLLEGGSELVFDPASSVGRRFSLHSVNKDELGTYPKLEVLQ
ncbi:MAG TPA: hypothetical protein VEA59_04885 [Patescibacteria group bacterium]|nr:hypothetical protein [Patescibacteria group bacterium]